MRSGDVLADVVVIGGGISGASVAYELARATSVVLMEAEPTPGYHSTGRSAALLLENYGNRTVRLLTRASRTFLANPPAEFAAQPLLTPRGAMWIARADQLSQLALLEQQGRDLGCRIHRPSATERRALCPIVDPDYLAGALLEPGAMDIDVTGLHQGYLAGFRNRGGRLLTGAPVLALERDRAVWQVRTHSDTIRALHVVNAAGAWCDEIARMAGVPPVGLVAKRRTVITFDPPAGAQAHQWPCVIDAEEQFYFKPESTRILASPGDQTPMAPQDTQPEELDVAVAVDRVERATTLDIRRVTHKWAGLRCFVADNAPVVGAAPGARGFFWLAGQGGFGVMTAPALSRIAAGLLLEGAMPAEITDMGLAIEELSPGRL